MHKVYKIYIIVMILLCCIGSSFIYVNESFENSSNIVKSNAYVISLNDRLFERAKNNLSRNLPITLNKFNAIKGSALTSFNNKLMTIGAYRSILYDFKRRAHADLGSFNAIGCATSHASLWEKIKPGEGMYIFESDAILTEDPTPYVKEFLKTPNPHILLFGPIGSTRSTIKPKIKRVNYHFFGMHGYYITYKGAQLLLKYFYPIEQQVDSYISDLILIDKTNNKKVHFGINVYIINPGICYQYNIDGTSIQTKSVK